jgi:hypothetical protein
VETTPYELWHGKKPTLLFLRVWGCEAYVKKLQPDKLESKSEKCIFVGYPRKTLGYTFYHAAEGKTFVAKTGIFLEIEFLAKGVGGRKVELDEIVDPLVVRPPWSTPDDAPSPIKSLPMENPKTIGEISRRVPQLRCRHRRILGDRSLCSGILPGWGSAPGAISIGLHHRLRRLHRPHRYLHRRCCLL